MKRAKIVVIGGPMAGLEFALTKDEVTLGRGRGQDIWLPFDQEISRRHAVLRFKEGTYWLQDAGSVNGTFLGLGKIDKETELPMRATFRLGETLLRLLSVAEAPGPSEQPVSRAQDLLRHLLLQLEQDKLSSQTKVRLAKLLEALSARLEGVQTQDELIDVLLGLIDQMQDSLGPAASTTRDVSAQAPGPLAASGAEQALAIDRADVESLRNLFISDLTILYRKIKGGTE